MPGVLKNALDWASRPGFASPMKNKPALVMTASPGTAGGVRAQHQIRETLAAVLARPVAYPHIAIASVHQKITDGRLDDAATLDFVLRAVDALLDEVRLLARDR
jgi:chromate reductase